MAVKEVEAWLKEQDIELAKHIIEQARKHARGDKVLYEDLIHEGVKCALEAGHLHKEVL